MLSFTGQGLWKTHCNPGDRDAGEVCLCLFLDYKQNKNTLIQLRQTEQSELHTYEPAE